MADRADITPEFCRQLLRYDPETGKLWWRARPREMFSSGRLFAAWTVKYEGREAFISLTSDGYRKGQIDRITFRAHRVAWAIVHGAWPDGEIDHINGNPSDNRISNLRVVDAATNNRNLGRRSDNQTGVSGVSFHAKSGRWHARIREAGRFKHLGSFTTKAEAVDARRVAEVEFGYHPNHGR